MKLIEIAHAGVISEAPTISSILLRALQYLLYVFGFVAIISIIISGLMYMLSRGDRRMVEKSKKSLFYGIAGIIVALTSLLIVRLIGRIVAG